MDDALIALVVDCVAVSEESLSAKDVATALQTLTGEPVDIDDVRRCLRRGVAHGLTVGARSRMAMRDADRDARIAERQERGGFVPLALAVDKALAFRTTDPDLAHRHPKVRRRIRLALAMGEAPTRTDVATVGPEVVAGWFHSPGSALALTPPAMAAVLAAMADAVARSGRPMPGLADAIERAWSQHREPRLATVAARWALYTGRVDVAVERVQTLREQDARLAAAQVRLFSGDVRSAARSYAAAVRDEGVAVLQSNVDGAFAPLAYVLDGATQRVKQAGTWARVHGVATDAPHIAWRSVLAVVDPMLPSPPMPSHPLAALFHAVCCWCRGVHPDAQAVELAAGRADALEWSGIAQSLRMGPAGPGLSQVRPRRPEWAVRIESLMPTPAKASSVSQIPRRIGWFVTESHGEVSLVAREQVKRNGSWTRGRPIASDRLSPEFPGWTPADEAVLEARVLRPTSRWGGTVQTSVSWAARTVWPALARHPAVFTEEGRPLTIAVVLPKLIVSEGAHGTEVQIAPRPNGSGIAVQPIGDGFEVTFFSPEQLRLAHGVGAGLVVPEEGRAALEDLLAASRGLFVVQHGAMDASERAVAAEIAVRLAPKGGGIRAELVVLPMGPDGPVLSPGEGPELVLARTEEGSVRLRRDRLAEAEAAAAVLSLPGLTDAEPDGDVWRLPTASSCLELLAALRRNAVPVYWPQGGALRFRETVTAERVNVSIRSSGNWFEADGSVTLNDGMVLRFRDLLKAVQRSSGRFVQLTDGTWLELAEQLKADLDETARLAAEAPVGVRVHRLVAESVLRLAGDEGAAPEVLSWQDKLHAVQEPVPVPSGLRATLRPYQVQAFEWLVRLSRLGIGAILADDMGLGKTVSTLAVLVHRAQDGPALVVCPTSVAGNWRRECERFAPGLRVHLLRGEVDRLAVLRRAGPGDLVIASYGLLVSQVQALSDVSWSTAVFDESQALKNAQTQRHQAALRVQADMRIALTGTPIENHSGELHAQVDLVNPGMLGDASLFRKRFAKPIANGNAQASLQLRALVTPYLLRRTKEQVLHELPPRTDIDVPISPTEGEMALYEAQRQIAVDSLNEARGKRQKGAIDLLAHLTRLRRIACSPALELPDFEGPSSKTRAFMDLADKVVRSGGRALVFSQFLGHLALLRTVLEDRGYAFHYLDGATAAGQRDAAVDAFQQGDAPFFLISTRAGGTGINLTAAETVIHMDPWWNPAVEDQASDRAHRIGQDRPVTVYRLFTQGTVEEDILDLHRRKRALAADLLAEGDAATRLDATTLLNLLNGAKL